MSDGSEQPEYRGNGTGIFILYEFTARPVFPLEQFAARLAGTLRAETVEIMIRDGDDLITEAAWGLPAPDLPPAIEKNIPLIHEGIRLGAVRLRCFTRRGFTSEEERTILVIAGHLARELAGRSRERELRRSEARFRQVADAVGEFIWEVDARGRYTYASPAVEAMLGYAPEELVGKKYFYDLFFPDKREELKRAAFEAFARKMPFKMFINENRHKNGQLVVLETGGWPILGINGELLGYRGADADVTERISAERELKEKVAELEEFHDLTVGRELKMVELEKEVDSLLRELGRPAKYQ